MLDLSSNPPVELPGRGSVRWMRIASTVAILWGLILIAANATRVPTVSDVYDDDVYAAMTPTELAKVCKRLVLRPPSGSTSRPPVKRCASGQYRSRPVPGVRRFGQPREILFNSDVSDSEADLVVAAFQTALNDVVRAQRTSFVIRGVLWWLVSTAACVTVAFAMIRRLRVERWTARQLALSWIVAATLVGTWLAWFGGTIPSLFNNSTYIPSRVDTGLFTYSLFPIVTACSSLIVTWMFSHSSTSREPLSRTDRQWLTVWAGVVLIMLIWWNGRTAAAQAIAFDSVRDRYVPGLERADAYDLAFTDAYRAELAPRLIGSVVVLTAFGVWYVGKRQ